MSLYGAPTFLQQSFFNSSTETFFTFSRCQFNTFLKTSSLKFLYSNVLHKHTNGK